MSATYNSTSELTVIREQSVSGVGILSAAGPWEDLVATIVTQSPYYLRRRGANAYIQRKQRLPFDFSYRLPFVRKWLTLYTDSWAHDDVNPISAPRRGAIRPGIYLSHVPGLAPLDFRVEAVSTDPPTSRSNGGGFLYTEQVYLEGYTNKGYIIGDWIGRESKGGLEEERRDGRRKVRVKVERRQTPRRVRRIYRIPQTCNS
jgi:hypothetical protein